MGAMRGDPSVSDILFADAPALATAGVRAVKSRSDAPRFGPPL